MPSDLRRTLRVPVVAGLLISLFAVAALGGCADDVRRFPNAEPMWDDPDRTAFAPMPEEYWSPFGWDAVDQTLFRPLARLWLFEPEAPAVNVNAMDEVPDSSWYTNRLLDASGRAMTPEEIAAGPCTEPAPTTKWVVTSAKPNGANPGFVMKADDGNRYVVKFDGLEQPERGTAADVIGSKIYWAAGYWGPCNRVVIFNPAIVEIADDATSEKPDGTEIPLEWSDIERVLSKAHQLEDGRYRASLSLFLDGRPLGPWKYQSTRDDDPNDVIDHQERRELRGMYVLAAWLNHFDSREQNTLAMWISPEGAAEGTGHVRHNMIDFGDCFGSLWAWDGISRRLGHAYYLDIGYVVRDLLTLGFVDRPWDNVRMGAAGAVFGYYHIDRFVPDRWKPGYPNPAFSRHTERDAAWMARKIARFDDAVIDALIAEAKFEHDDLGAELRRLMIGRRDKILRRYLVDTPLSPLSNPRFVASDIGPAELCLDDTAVVGGVALSSVREYRARSWDDADAPLLGPAIAPGADPGVVCMSLPRQEGASASDPRYLLVDVFAATPGVSDHAPLRIHLWDEGESGVRVVGLERPETSTVP